MNARKLKEVKDYFVGVVLPPHLSPFVEEGEGEYVPPERVQLLERAEDEGKSASVIRPRYSLKVIEFRIIIINWMI